MKILITGGCGFVGTNIALFLNKKKGLSIYSLDNLSRKGSKYNLKHVNAGKDLQREEDSIGHLFFLL